MLEFFHAHNAFTVAGAAAAVHFAHLAWPKLTAAYPYAAANGGVVGIVKRFFFGNQTGSVVRGVPPGPAPEPTARP